MSLAAGCVKDMTDMPLDIPAFGLEMCDERAAQNDFERQKPLRPSPLPSKTDEIQRESRAGPLPSGQGADCDFPIPRSLSFCHLFVISAFVTFMRLG